MSDRYPQLSLKNLCLFFVLLQFFVFLFFYFGIQKTERQSGFYACSQNILLPATPMVAIAKNQPSVHPTTKPDLAQEITVPPQGIENTDTKEAQYDELKKIKSEQDPEIDIVNPDVKHSPDYTRDFLIDRQCPIANCIEMSLDFKNKNDAHFNAQPEPEGQTLYTFKLRAKHDDNRSFKYLNAVIKGNASLSRCSSIGNNTVAVLGFTLSKNPIISTQRGPLIVQDNNVLIGKKDGFKIYRNDKLIKKLLSPNRNFSQYSTQSMAFHLNPNGQLFFKRAGSSQCISYSDDQYFQISTSRQCNFRLEKDPNYSAKFEQSANEHLNLPANNDNNHALAIYHKTCS